MAFFSLLIIFPVLQTIQETTAYGINIENKNYIYTIVYSITLAINVGGGLLFVKKYGMTGVAFANFLSAIICFSATSIVGQKLYKSITYWRKTLIGIILLLVEGLVPVFIESDWELIIWMAVIMLLSTILYKDIIEYAKNLIAKRFSNG